MGGINNVPSWLMGPIKPKLRNFFGLERETHPKAQPRVLYLKSMGLGKGFKKLEYIKTVCSASRKLRFRNTVGG